MARVTLNSINKALALVPELSGIELVRGKDYFYFAGGNAHEWNEAGVYGTCHLSALSIEQWVDEAKSRHAMAAEEDNLSSTH